MRTRSLVWVILASLLALPAAADPPNPAAEALHQKAAEMYKDGSRAEAIEFWWEAMRLGPHWKYAYNLANASYEDGKFEPAWRAAEQAEQLNMPDKYMVQLGGLRAKISAELKKTHAYLALMVQPESCTVTRDGLLWAKPRAGWFPSRSSAIRITHPGYDPRDLTWDHAIGKRHSKAIALKKSPKKGSVTVAGSPAGATVSLGGREVGKLPRVGPLRLSPGTYTMSIAHAGYITSERRVVVEEGQSMTLAVELAETPPEVMVQSGTSGLQIGGWVATGVGVALAGVAGGLLAIADNQAQDMKRLQADPKYLNNQVDYLQYKADFKRRQQDHAEMQMAGYVLVGVGAAAAVAGVVMLVIPGADAGDGTTIGVAPLPGGGFLSTTVVF